MAKTLPVMGIVGAVFGALAIAVLVPDTLAMFVPLLVALVGSVMLVAQRTILGAVAGLVVLVLTVVAALGLIGYVSTENGGGTSLGVSVATGQVLVIAACLALPVAAVALRWEQFEPRWLAIGGVACAVLAFILVAANPEDIAQQAKTGTLIAMVLALLSAGPMVPLLRSAGDDPP